MNRRVAIYDLKRSFLSSATHGIREIIPDHSDNNLLDLQFLKLITESQWGVNRTSANVDGNPVNHSEKRFFHDLLTTGMKKTIIFIKVYDISPKTYVETQFEHLTPSDKTIMNEVMLDVSVLFDGDPISVVSYINPETKNIMIFHSYGQGVKGIIRTLMSIMMSLTESEITPELEKLLLGDASEEAWYEYYTKQEGDPFADFYKQLNNKELEKIQIRMRNLKREYDDEMSRLNTISQKISEAKDLIASLPEVFKEQVSFKEQIETIPEIVDVKMSINGPEKVIAMNILTNMQLESELINSKVISSPKMLKFFQYIESGRIQVKFGQELRISYRNGDIGIRGISFLYSNLFQEFTIIQNPHIEQHQCFGTFKHRINEAVNSKNIYAMCIASIRAIAQFNLVDSVVYGEFIKFYFNDGAIKVYDVDEDATVSYNTFLQMEQQKEQNNEETTD